MYETIKTKPAAVITDSENTDDKPVTKKKIEYSTGALYNIARAGQVYVIGDFISVGRNLEK